jgi:MFS family permease
MLFIGSTIGTPLVGAISDKIQRRRLPMLVGAVLSLMTVLIFIYVPYLSVTTYAVLFFLLGLLTCSQTIGYVLAVEHNPQFLTGTSVSIVSMTCLLGGAFGLPFSGWLLDLGWDGKMVDNAPWYSANAYHHAMLIMPVAFVIGFIAAYFIKETYCRPQHD